MATIHCRHNERCVITYHLGFIAFGLVTRSNGCSNLAEVEADLCTATLVSPPISCGRKRAEVASSPEIDALCVSNVVTAALATLNTNYCTNRRFELKPYLNFNSGNDGHLTISTLNYYVLCIKYCPSPKRVTNYLQQKSNGIDLSQQ